MDPYLSFRTKYYAAVPHSFYVGLTWITGGIVADLVSPGVSIITFIAMIMINFPIGELLRKKFFNSEITLDPSNKLPMLFSLMAITVPASLPVVLFACINNINYFYPALAIIVGAHYLPFYYGYRLRSFLFIGGLIWIEGTLIGLYLRDQFSLAAYVTGILIIIMAVINLMQMKRSS